MPVSLALTQANVVSGTNKSVYSYNFPNSAVFKDGDRVALQNLNIYYSWNNITAAYKNNSFSYTWVVGVAVTTYVVTLPDGFYTIGQINAYLQSVMYANNHYLINGAGNYVYYLEIVANSIQNAFQINSYPIPTSLPAGYTAPAGWGGYPTSLSTPQFIIPATNIQTLLGFTVASYPLAIQTTAYSAISNMTPQISPVTSVFLMCNLVKNNLSRPNQILYNFSPNTTYGSQIQITPPFQVFVPIQQGSYPSITISFLDQNFNPLVIGDSNISILLAIKTKDERD